MTGGFGHGKPDKMSATGLKAYIRIVDAWSLSDKEAAELLAMSEEAWAEARGPDSASPLSQDQLLRLSGILGIYQSLELYFLRPMARDWFTKSNDGPLFGGLRPVDAALAGGLPMIVQIRDYVDALLQGN